MSATCLEQPGAEATAFTPCCSTLSLDLHKLFSISDYNLRLIFSLAGFVLLWWAFFVWFGVLFCLVRCFGLVFNCSNNTSEGEDSKSSFKLALHECCSLLIHVNDRLEDQAVFFSC